MVASRSFSVGFALLVACVGCASSDSGDSAGDVVTPTGHAGAAQGTGGTGGTSGIAGSGGTGGGKAGAGGVAVSSCMPGATELCVGPGACKGGQVCGADGKSWGPCDCGSGGTSSGGSGGKSTGGAASGGKSGAGAGGSAGGSVGAGGEASAGMTGTGGDPGTAGSGGSPGAGGAMGPMGGGGMTPTSLDLHDAMFFDNPTNLADWPETTQITDLEFQYMGDGVHVEFSKQDGTDRWPDITPPGWEGSLQYTLGMAEYVNGQWVASAAIQYWYGLASSGGNVALDDQVAKNWYYDGRWGPLAGRQPATGEIIGIFVVAGNLRGVTDGSQSPVMERSNVVLVPMPDVAGAKYTF